MNGRRSSIVNRRLIPVAIFATVLAGLPACELEEIAIPSGDEVLIVHAIMRPDQQRQFVLLESSWRGEVDPGERDHFPVPPNPPQLPIRGAVVTVSNIDLPSDPCGSAVVFNERTPGVYRGPGNCPTMGPGDHLQLQILIPNGKVIRGTTVVVGLDSAWVRGALGTLPFGALDSMIFNRDSDTLQFAVYSSYGRLVELQVTRLDYYGDLSTSGFDRGSFLADTNNFIVPGMTLDLLERGEGDEVFRAGRRYMMTVAMTDANYFDFVRSQNSELTGRGFINHLEGAVGVFGSLVALPLTLDAIGQADDPKEGTYRLTGTIQDVDVDATLSLYQRHQADSVEVSGFLRGTWIQKLRGPPGGWIAWDPRGLSIDGSFVGAEWDITVEQPALTPFGEIRGTRLFLRATWAESGFVLKVQSATVFGAFDLGVLTAVKIP